MLLSFPCRRVDELHAAYFVVCMKYVSCSASLSYSCVVSPASEVCVCVCVLLCSGRRQRGQQAYEDVVHATSDAWVGERISLQPLSVSPSSHWDRARAQPERAPDQNLVSKQTHEVEERASRPASAADHLRSFFGRRRTQARPVSSTAASKVTLFHRNSPANRVTLRHRAMRLI